MDTVVSTGRSWLTRPRVVGTPLHWARHTALYGALAGSWVPLSLPMLSWIQYPPSIGVLLAYTPMLLAGLLAGALLGGLVGLAQPVLLDRVRGRVRLPVLALAQAGVGAVAGTAIGLTWLLTFMGFYGPPVASHAPGPWEMAALMGGLGAGTGALTTLLWWLPFTAATVLQVRAWPVTAAAVVAGGPVWLWVLTWSLGLR